MADFTYTSEDDTLVGTGNDDRFTLYELLPDQLGLIDGGDGYDVVRLISPYNTE